MDGSAYTIVETNSTLEAANTEVLSPLARRLIAAYVICIGFIGILGNIAVWAIYCRFKSLKMRSSILILNLAFADLGICVFGFPFITVAAIHGSWVFGNAGCQWYAFNGMFFGLASIGCLTIISLDRYMLTCRYHTYLDLKTRHYVISCLIVWFNSFFWSSMPLIGWSKYALDPSHIACLLGLANPDMDLIAYIMCIFIVCFVIPVLIISVSYYKTWQQIKGIGDGGAQENIEWTNHKQITKMSIVVVIMFMITWSPYALVHLYAIFYPSSLVSPLFGIIPALFAKSSTAYNPIIYALINKRFRLALKKLCGCIFTRKDRQALQVHNLI